MKLGCQRAAARRRPALGLSRRRAARARSAVGRTLYWREVFLALTTGWPRLRAGDEPGGAGLAAGHVRTRAQLWRQGPRARRGRQPLRRARLPPGPRWRRLRRRLCAPPSCAQEHCVILGRMHGQLPVCKLSQVNFLRGWLVRGCFPAGGRQTCRTQTQRRLVEQSCSGSLPVRAQTVEAAAAAPTAARTAADTAAADVRPCVLFVVLARGMRRMQGPPGCYAPHRVSCKRRSRTLCRSCIEL